MYCNHCGAQMDDSAVFCTNCGAKLDHGDRETGQVKNYESVIGQQPAREPPKVTGDIEKTISIAQIYGFDNQPAQPAASQPASARQAPDRAWQPQPAPQNQPSAPKHRPPAPQYQPPQPGSAPQYQQTQNGYGTNYANTYSPASKPSNSVTFGKAVRLFFENYVNFTGRASKSEYWWGFLFTFLMSFTIIGGFICCIGMLSLAIRRLHDVGKSLPWIFMGLIPCAGPIILIVYYCKDSAGDNQWGPGPKLN